MKRIIHTFGRGTIKLLPFFYYLVYFTSGMYAQTTHYVKPIATGTADGSSWDNASGDLQEMINISIDGDSIFVAKGVYKPNRNADDLSTISLKDKYNAFVPKSGVNIYGGFDPDNGISELIHKRISPNLGSGSILSGDFDDNDSVTGGGSTLSLDNNSDNAYRVVIFSNVASNTIFDGFAITGANCVSGTAITVDGINIPGGDAGGMMITASSPIINNIVIYYNKAAYGGGIYVGTNSSPEITNAVIFKNYASNDGGGVMNYGSAASPVFTNTTVAQNYAVTGGGIRVFYVSSASIRNSIIWANKSGISSVGNAPSVTYSLIQSGYTGTGNLSSDPLFKDMNANDYTVPNNSPATDSGNDTYVSNTFDIAGNPRICGSKVDMGAYENLNFIFNEASLDDIIGSCEITSLTPPTATNCLGAITGTHNITLPITTSTTITWTYEDVNGNIAIQTQDVIIEDTIKPIADVATLADITSVCEVATLTAPTATDNCSGAIAGTHDATLPITSSTTITWTYEDDNGNIVTQTQNVVITGDTTAPVPDETVLTDIISSCEITEITAPTATDNCSGAITGTHNATLPISASTTITWTYDDGNGNISTQLQNVLIGIDNSLTLTNGQTLTANESNATYQWIDCNNGNQPIIGETNQSFTVSTDGSYAVAITLNGCTELSSCITINSVGIETLVENKGWNVYPIPTNGIFMISTDKFMENTLIEVYSPDGRLIYSTLYSGTEMSVDLQNQSNGVYILKVNGGITFRIIKD